MVFVSSLTVSSNQGFLSALYSFVITTLSWTPIASGVSGVAEGFVARSSGISGDRLLMVRWGCSLATQSSVSIYAMTGFNSATSAAEHATDATFLSLSGASAITVHFLGDLDHVLVATAVQSSGNARHGYVYTGLVREFSSAISAQPNRVVVFDSSALDTVTGGAQLVEGDVGDFNQTLNVLSVDITVGGRSDPNLLNSNVYLWPLMVQAENTNQILGTLSHIFAVGTATALSHGAFITASGDQYLVLRTQRGALQQNSLAVRVSAAATGISGLQPFTLPLPLPSATSLTTARVVASSTSAALDALRTFAVSLGWTVLDTGMSGLAENFVIRSSGISGTRQIVLKFGASTADQAPAAWSCFACVSFNSATDVASNKTTDIALALAGVSGGTLYLEGDLDHLQIASDYPVAADRVQWLYAGLVDEFVSSPSPTPNQAVLIPATAINNTTRDGFVVESPTGTFNAAVNAMPLWRPHETGVDKITGQLYLTPLLAMNDATDRVYGFLRHVALATEYVPAGTELRVSAGSVTATYLCLPFSVFGGTGEGQVALRRA